MGRIQTTTPPHVFAELFPLYEGQTLWELSDDIKENGQLEPIILFEDKILDGRRRELACIRAGVGANYKQFKGKQDEALSFVISKNLHRRNLTVAERAFIANKIATMKLGQKKADTPNGGSSQQEVADQMGIGTRSIQRAREVEQNGTPELIEAAKTGEISLGDAASVAKESPKTQNRAVKAVRSGKAKTAKAAVSGKISFKFKIVDEAFGELVRSLSKAHDAWGDNPKQVECRKHLDKAYEAWEAWKQSQ